MIRLDRAGIFKAAPLAWWIKNSQGGAVAISFDFRILAQLDGSGWADWSEYDEHQVSGDWWIIKRDGTVNTQAVEQLSQSLGWDGDINALQGDPPDCVVQITVREEQYEGKTYFRATWMNPRDFVPRSGAAPEVVSDIKARFGSLLRAAAGASLAKRPAAAKPAAPVMRPAPVATPVETDEEPAPF